MAELFATPRADSRPTILWFWNGTVTNDLVTAELADIRARGIHEVLIFPFDTLALQPRFFTEEWFALIEFTLREAQRNDMHLWLFNDDFFPSGRGGGFVVNGGQVGDRVYQPRPELRPHGVGKVTLAVSGGDSVTLVNHGLVVTAGRLLVDASIRDGITLLRAGADWRDYDVQATVRVERATAGLMVRSPDASNGYLADMRIDGGVDIWRQQNGGFSLLYNAPGVPGFNPAVDHVLKVAVRGTHILASVDGVSQRTVVDATFPTGRVGMRAVATQRSSWDSVTVIDAGGQVLYSDQFDTDASIDAFDLPDALPSVAATARPEGSADIAGIVDLTDIARRAGEWTAPPGKWQLDLFTVRPLGLNDDSRHTYLDLLDDEAVNLFLDIVPGEYLRRFPWAVGGVLRGFADDEPFIASAVAHFNAVPWSGSLDDELSRLGVAPGLALTAVHDDFGPPGLRLRGVFWRAVANRFAAAYFRTQGQWMADHGMKFISNPLWDEYGPAEQVKSTGDLHTDNQWAQVPGTDLVFDHYQRGYHRTLSRYPASTAHQLGLERVYLEAMGGTGWAVTPAFTREVVGAFAVRGVNHTLLHARFSDSGDIVYPPPFQPVNPWWSLSAPLNDWIGRLMEAGRAPARARTVLLQPQRAAESFQDTDAKQSIDDSFTNAVHALEDVQVDFDLVDEGALDNDPALVTHALARGPRLVLGQQAYQIMVVPQTPMLALGTAQVLVRFVHGGGTVIVTGDLPTQESGGDNTGLRQAVDRLFLGAHQAIHAPDPTAAAAAAVSAGGAAVSLTPPMASVRALRLESGRERAFVLTNELATAVDVTATFPATGVPEIWDPETGTTDMAGVWRSFTDEQDDTEIPLRLEPKATLLVVFRARQEPAHAVSSTAPVERIHGQNATVRVTAPGPVTVVVTADGQLYQGTANVTDALAAVPLDGDWRFHFDRADSPTVTRPLGSWTDLDGGFSGSAWYEKDISLDDATLTGHRWILDLGEVHDVAEIEINGAPLGSRLWPPYRLDVTPALRPGDNLVRVRVTNTGANAHGEQLPSGLFGPVSLRPELLVDIPLALTS
ncbi:glycosylhydrolase-like jelly roll fold domain-containing protein [Actinocrispum wychmicini]|uniref:Alpha-L-rhamnosidase-like protein n=1 Tax=Actinocrispum wychmicini TaxID=1213861 RepID=A0A4V2S631_9PSEU|nr:glycosylhydrolase-like jelly roll fold domain-containing protein [Actinocrispum wychmicini]TCO54270.1 alpha-L-rhamnosidase-like protein [Actinocrispum wychmicini]